MKIIDALKYLIRTHPRIWRKDEIIPLIIKIRKQ